MGANFGIINFCPPTLPYATDASALTSPEHDGGGGEGLAGQEVGPGHGGCPITGCDVT